MRKIMMQQNYEAYQAKDQAVWQLLFKRQWENLEDKAVPELWPALKAAQSALNGQAIPNFKALSPLLQKEQNFSIELVSGLIPVEEFFALLAQRRFPSSCWLRKMEELDYLGEPDMFHDTFGHIPLLFNAQYADFMQEFGRIGLQVAHLPQAVAALERLYWFTIEFGVCQNTQGRAIYGAGILSSFGESVQVHKGQNCEFRPFVLESVLKHHFHKHEMQSVYYYLDNFQSLFGLLKSVEQRLLTLA